MNNKELKWGCLGCGSIANEMAVALAGENRGFCSVANRTYENALTFAEKYGIEKIYRNAEDIFYDKEVDAIYLATPHSTHYRFIKQALEAGKHILVEKSITLNLKELEEVSSIAEEKGLIIAEAQTIWHMPIYEKLKEEIEKRNLGRAQIITVNFGSFKEYDLSNRFFNLSLAGGALLDIGIYALSLIRRFMDKPADEVKSEWTLSPTGSDENSVIILKNGLGQMATVAVSIHSKQPKRAMISLERAYVEIMEYPRADEAVITDAQTGERTMIRAGKSEKALYYEIRDFEKAVFEGDKNILLLDYSKDIMSIMTDLRREWGLTYPDENL